MQKVNYSNQREETKTLFNMYNVVAEVKLSNFWYINNGCSNHMKGDERLLINVQIDLSSKVKMGIREIVSVAGKGTLVIETKLGMKHIQ